jgi:hypothetical protein
MSEIASASINSFAPVVQQANVSPSEPIFVLSGSQLQDLITRAIQPLRDEIESLRATVARQDKKMAALEATQDSQAENELNILRLINDLRKEQEPQPLQRDRGEILRALLAVNGGKMLRYEARKKMHISESRISELLVTMSDYIEVRPYHLNKNQKVLVLK